MATALSQFNFSVTMKAVLSESREGTNVSASAGTTITPANLANGTAANQSDLWMQDTGRAVTSGSNDDLDIFDWAQTDSGPGAGRDLIANPVSFVEVMGILVFNQTGSAGNMTVGGEGSTAAWASLFNGSDIAAFGPVGPGGILFGFNPADPAVAVADTSNHLLRVAASGGNITYDIYVCGRTA